MPFGALVETGMIAPGAMLTDAKRRWQARVLADASVELGGEQGSIHKIGADRAGRAVVQRLDLLAFRGERARCCRSMRCASVTWRPWPEE